MVGPLQCPYPDCGAPLGPHQFLFDDSKGRGFAIICDSERGCHRTIVDY
jgi:hypothetical protein